MIGVALSLATSVCQRAVAQVLPPRAITETIGPVFVPPGQVVDLIFPNEFDLTHPKRLLWEGFTTTTGDPAQGGITMYFDWLNPFTGGFDVSPGIPLPPGVFSTAIFIIPFCPQQVSIHFETDNPAGYMVEGKFTHECLVPEPRDYALLAGTGLVAFGLIRRRWRR
jgi:hypothetical protein